MKRWMRPTEFGVDRRDDRGDPAVEARAVTCRQHLSVVIAGRAAVLRMCG